MKTFLICFSIPFVLALFLAIIIALVLVSPLILIYFIFELFVKKEQPQKPKKESNFFDFVMKNKSLLTPKQKEQCQNLS